MLTANHSWQGLPSSFLNTTTLVQLAITPVLATATLLLSCLAFGQPIGGAYLILALLVFALTFFGHLPAQGERRLEIAADIVTNWLAIIALLMMFGWVTRTLGFFDQRVMLTWILATPLLLTTGQFLYPILLSKLIAVEGVQRVAVIAGAGELAHRLQHCIEQSPHLGIRVAGCFDDRAPVRLHETTPHNIVGGLDQIAAYAKQHHVDLIYINLPMTSQPRIVKLLNDLHDTTASIYFVPDIFLFDLIQARVDTIGDMPVLAVCETPFYGVDGLLKRASDLVLATAILILIAPIMLAIAIAIKRSSPGPVLFKQRRYGLDGREIIVYKFRTMTVCEDGPEIRQATQDDNRVTKLGAFLRASSLDELPQFINVLQGRMSVVGPRPHAVAHNEMYRKLINGYMIRHKVRPGITGWAQVNGQRGETATLDKMKARIEYDLAYLRNWSLRLDLLIILKTVFVVWKRQNAY
ncbi:putative UDP-sugar lipid carrier transferase [Georgfuchsia toluolica]|uniref:UDP-sugar lipid carrier transferase n=1 Tax=Georgfuchsia toluolica TaxID=424218 RepID=A0A916N8Q5_9PROT|nr:undecaprenyl-phosphate glucose phosphotransferase [Georgfuchsia toluolica]CAG4882878.1 putative UDP-sugar lipid carrier transferase [Georgfuchsia toluolica]